MGTKKKSASAEGATAPETKPPVIYIGPTVGQISVIQHRIYRNGLPPECEKLISKVPGAKHLFVATSEYAAATSRLNDRTSVEAVMYANVAAAIKELK